MQILDLENNAIEEISGLDHLINLKVLLISNNQIFEIKGMGNLNKLECLHLWGNLFSGSHLYILDKLGGISECGPHVNDP
ncbi:MAG: hypothetical protein ACTSXN_02310 [Promethearchaeota archaeon]